MDRLDWYFRQLVREDEMDLAFDQVQDRIEQAASQNEMGLDGMVIGGGVTEDSPPDLTVVVGDNGLGYGPDGKRIQWDAGTAVDMSEDDLGAPTAVTTPGYSRILSVFVEFDEAFDDLRTDGFGLPVYFRINSSHRFFVVMSDEGTDPVPPSLLADALLLADVTLIYGQTTIQDSDIDLSRRQDFYRQTGSRLSIVEGRMRDAFRDLHDDYNAFIEELAGQIYPAGASMVGIAAWSLSAGGEPLGWISGTTVEAALRTLITQLTDTNGAERIGWNGYDWLSGDHVAGAFIELIDGLESTTSPSSGSTRIGLSEIDYTPAGSGGVSLFLDNDDLQTNLDSLVSQLTYSGGSDCGAARIGSAGKTGSIVSMPSPATLAQGSVSYQLQRLVDYIETIRNTPFSASAVTFTPHDYVTSTNVQAAINELIDDLQSTAAGSGSGTDEIGFSGTSGGDHSAAAPSYDYPAGTLYNTLVAMRDEINKRAALYGAQEPFAFRIAFKDDNFWLDFLSGTDPTINLDSGGDYITFDRSENDLLFYIGSSRAMRIKSGAVRIGVGPSTGGLAVGVDNYWPDPASAYVALGGGSTSDYPPSKLWYSAGLGNWLYLQAGAISPNGSTQIILRASDGGGSGDYHQIKFVLDDTEELFLDNSELRPSTSFGLDLGTTSYKWNNVNAKAFFPRNIVAAPSSQEQLAGRYASNGVVVWGYGASAGGLVGNHYNVTTAVRNSQGNYTVTFDQPVDVNCGVAVTPTDVATDICVSANLTSTTTLAIQLRDASSGAVWDSNYSFIVVGRPNSIAW